MIALPEKCRHRQVCGYVLAATVTPLVLVARFAAGFQHGELEGLVLLVPAIIVSAYVGGLGPGLLATAISALGSDVFWLSTTHSVEVPTLGAVRWAGLIVTGVLVSVLNERLHRSQSRAMESQQLLAITVASVGEGVICVDASGHITFINNEAERLTGWPAKEALGQYLEAVFHVIHEGTRESTENLAMQVLRTGHIRGLANHTIVVARTGAETVIENKAAPIRDAENRIAGVVLVFRDCSEHKRVEKALRERVMLRDQLARIAETAPGVICAFRVNADGTSCYPYASARIEEIFGLDADALASDAAAAIARIHPDDQERVRRSAAQSARDLTPWSEEFRVHHPSRGDIWVEGLSMPEREPGGGTLWRGFLNDITRRKKAEQAREASEARFRQIAESIREVFWLTDPAKGEMVYLSPAYETIWGKLCKSVYDAPLDWVEAIHPDDRARVVEAAMTKQVSGQYDEEYRIVRPDGTIRWVRDRAFPVRDANDQLIRVAGVAEDITERRLLEAQLRQAQKMESVGQLAGGVAHDFNNALTVIMGSAEHLAETLSDDRESLETIGEIRHAAERATSLTRQLLAFSRKEVIEPRVIDINTLVADTEKMLRRLLGEDVELTSALDATIGRVRVDPGQWVQVLMNLAVNARDAMSKSGKLTIATGSVDIGPEAKGVPTGMGPGAYVRLTVTDNGSGMSASVLSHLFEPFFTTKGVGRGTGLGLAVVYGIVKQSGGYIDVESEQSVGTKFTFYLPMLDTLAASEAAATNASPSEGTETILLVEDEPSLRRIAVRGLGRRGYTIIEAESGNQALHLLDEHRDDIDLVVTDVVMPGMNGKELAERIFKIRPDLKVLYTSGYTHDAVIEHGVQTSMVAFLQKPYTPNALVTKVREVLGSPTS